MWRELAQYDCLIKVPHIIDSQSITTSRCWKEKTLECTFFLQISHIHPNIDVKIEEPSPKDETRQLVTGMLATCLTSIDWEHYC